MRRSNQILESIILKRATSPQGDLWLTLFDRERGKIKAIASSAVKPKSHRKGFLELGWYIYAQAYLSHDNFYRLGRIENAESFWPLFLNLHQASWLYRVLGLVDQGLGWQIPQPTLFDNLLDLFESLYYYLSFHPEIEEERIQLAFHSFETKLIYQLGYWPEKQLKSKKWQQIINFLLNKSSKDILTIDFKGDRRHFLLQLEHFFNQLHQSLLEYTPIGPDFFKPIKK